MEIDVKKIEIKTQDPASVEKHFWLTAQKLCKKNKVDPHFFGIAPDEKHSTVYFFSVKKILSDHLGTMELLRRLVGELNLKNTFFITEAWIEENVEGLICESHSELKSDISAYKLTRNGKKTTLKKYKKKLDIQFNPFLT